MPSLALHLGPWSPGEGPEGGPSSAPKLESHAALVKTLSLCAPFPLLGGQPHHFGFSEKGADTVSLPLRALPLCPKKRKLQGLGRLCRGGLHSPAQRARSVPGRGQTAPRSLPGLLTPQMVGCGLGEESPSCCLAGSSHSFALRWKDGRSPSGTAGGGCCEGKGRSPLPRLPAAPGKDPALLGSQVWAHGSEVTLSCSQDRA